jgi:hypothetical protein
MKSNAVVVCQFLLLSEVEDTACVCSGRQRQCLHCVSKHPETGSFARSLILAALPVHFIENDELEMYGLAYWTD